MRQRATAALLVLQAFVVALAALFHFGARVAVLDAFRAYDTAVPPPTALALTPWFLPSALAFAIVASAVAVLAPMKGSRRMWLLGGALVLSSFALMFAVAAAFLPMFQPAG